MADETTAGYLDGRIDALREHFASLIAAAPNLPAAFGGVRAQIGSPWQSQPGMKGASLPISDCERMMKSLIVFIIAWPIWMSPLA